MFIFVLTLTNTHLPLYKHIYNILPFHNTNATTIPLYALENTGVEKHEHFLYDYFTTFCRKHDSEINSSIVVCFRVSQVPVTNP